MTTTSRTTTRLKPDNMIKRGLLLILSVIRDALIILALAALIGTVIAIIYLKITV